LRAGDSFRLWIVESRRDRRVAVVPCPFIVVVAPLGSVSHKWFVFYQVLAWRAVEAFSVWLRFPRPFYLSHSHEYTGKTNKLLVFRDILARSRFAVLRSFVFNNMMGSTCIFNIFFLGSSAEFVGDWEL
jgi:hypothetical protein